MLGNYDMVVFNLSLHYFGDLGLEGLWLQFGYQLVEPGLGLLNVVQKSHRVLEEKRLFGLLEGFWEVEDPRLHFFHPF